MVMLLLVTRAIPASPVVSVHTAMLKPDIADRRIVGESVGDLVGWGRGGKESGQGVDPGGGTA